MFNVQYVSEKLIIKNVKVHKNGPISFVFLNAHYPGMFGLQESSRVLKKQGGQHQQELLNCGWSEPLILRKLVSKK